MDRFFGLDKVSYHSEDMELAETVYDNVRLAIVQSILEGEKIPYVVKYRGSNVVNVLFGGPTYGADVFVKKEMIETALEALRPYESEEKIDAENEPQ